MSDAFARAFDDAGPGIDETVIVAYDAVVAYRRLLREMAADEAREADEGCEAETFSRSIALCDKMIAELDEWGLNPKLEAC